MQSTFLKPRLLIVSLFIFWPLFSGAQLEVSPDIDWKILKSEHFEVIFNAKQQDLGRLYSEKLEKAFSDLRPYFHTMPTNTVVIINDKTDVTNGYATPIPYSHIMAYPVLPGPEESLADIGDWAYELLAHEFTHILTFAPAGGVVRPIKAVFGTIISPNLLLPRWWKEGVAVEMETRLSQHGRLRSVFQDATIRAMVADQTFLQYDIAEANESLPSWPQGARPYLFGSLMWSQMIADKDTSVIGDLHERHGRRAPYFIETPARDILGSNYTDKYNRMLSTTMDLAEAQMKILRSVSITPIKLPVNRLNSVTAPTVSPNGKHLVLIAENDSNSRSIKIITRKSDAESFLDVKNSDTIEEFNEVPNTALQRDGPPNGSIQRVSWFPDSKQIIYDKIDYSSRYERFSDLYIYDLETKKTRSLTKSLRAREPAVSTDGKSLAFVKLEGGKTQLAIVHLDKTQDSVEILFTPDIQQRISYPTFLNDHTLVFSLRKVDGTEHLQKMDLTTKTLQPLLVDFPNARFAKQTPLGLIFTSSRNGTHNVYLANPELTAAKPLTHTLTALFTADFDPKRQELFVTTMTSQGLRVGAITKENWSATPGTLPQIQPLLADRYKTPPLSMTPVASVVPTTTVGLPPEKLSSSAIAEQKPLPPIVSESVSEIATPSETLEDYSAAGYLWPRFWLPFIVGSSSETGLVIMAQTTAFDPLKKHTYSLAGSWDTGINAGSFEALYLNQQTRFPVTVLGYQRSSYFGTIDNRVEDYGAVAALSPDMFWLSPYANLQLGWQYLRRNTERHHVSREVKRTGPMTILSYADYSQSGAQISPESGWGGYVSADYFIQQQDYLDHSQFSAGLLTYFSKFLPRHHAIMLRLGGLYTPEEISAIYGDSTESQIFATDSILEQYILRGYARGQVYGRNMANLNFEYRFPLYRIEASSGTDAYFLKNLVGAIVADGVAADGYFVDIKTGAQRQITMSDEFWSAGMEVKLESTIGYTFPFNFIIGAYAAFNQNTGTEGSIGTRIQFSGF